MHLSGHVTLQGISNLVTVIPDIHNLKLVDIQQLIYDYCTYNRAQNTPSLNVLRVLCNAQQSTAMDNDQLN